MSDAGTRKHAMHNMSSADYWMACDIWYERKKRAIEQGKEFGGDSAASIRGTRLHELFEQGLREFLGAPGVWSPRYFARSVLGVNEATTIEEQKVAEEDAEQLAKALLAAGQVLELLVEPSVLLEVAVPLAHEPESQGYIDFIAFDEHKLFITDAKFGRIKVDPDCAQLFGYAGNVLRRLRAKGIPIPRKIFLGVIQPRHYTEALIHETSEAEIDAFMAKIVETVERQKAPGQKAGPKDLSPCTWCDFSTGCPARAELLAGMEAKLQTAITLQNQRAEDPDSGPADIPLPTELVEWILRSKSAIEDVLEECRELVLSDEKRFPNWRRTRTSNGQTWDLKTLDEEEVAGQLDQLGIEKFWRLRAPADLIAEFPDLKAQIRALTMESGFHFRLKALDVPPAEAASEGEDGAAAEPPKKRPPSRRIAQAVENAMEPAVPDSEDAPPVEKPKKKRGRPTKAESALRRAQQEIIDGAKASAVVKKKTKTRKTKGE